MLQSILPFREDFSKKNALFTDTMDEADESLTHITRYLFGLGRRIIKKNVRYLRGKQYSQDDQIIFMANDKIQSLINLSESAQN